MDDDDDDVWNYIDEPTLGPNGWEWNGVRCIRLDDGRGWRVLATRQLDAGLAVPYGGCLVTKKGLKQLEKRATDFHIMSWDDCAVDSNPVLLPPDQRFAWIGGLVNEAGPGELWNMRYVTITDYDPTMPSYPCPPAAIPRVFLELMSPVEEGEELLAYYGTAVNRPYSIAPPPPLVRALCFCPVAACRCLAGG
jgi:hypothetical protein